MLVSDSSQLTPSIVNAIVGSDAELLSIDLFRNNLKELLNNTKTKGCSMN
ncbi:MAG: hypothetical protein ACJA0H_000153, partial [Francisellaceae bacterium]